MAIANVNAGDEILASTMNDVINGVNGALPKTGGIMQGNIHMNKHRVTNIADPVANQDAATKKYVDEKELPMPVILDHSERSLNTFYQNSTGKPLYLTVNLYCDSGVTPHNASIRYSFWNDIGTAMLLGCIPVSSQWMSGMTVIIPKDHYYGVYDSDSKVHIMTWGETTLG
jgi:hypothetical protein